MDNLDDSENNAKISDSAYSNSCSNSQSRRSHSSKSTHSGSNSSGSSGYGGKPSTSGSSNNLEQSSKKEKKEKKKLFKPPEVKLVPEPSVVECRPPDPLPLVESKEDTQDVIETSMPPLQLPEKVLALEKKGMSISDHGTLKDEEGFSCVISMHDGVVMYTTSSLTATLGFPKDMWIGRSFIDFVHPRDRNTFASQITNGLAVPKIVNGTQEKAPIPSGSTMVCRIRRYRGLTTGFGIKDKAVTFMPFLLKFTFKNISDEEGNLIYLVIQATPFYSAFKTPNEVVTNAVPFVIRHAPNGHIEYIDPESVPYLGFLPQDVQDKDALQLYHPEDLPYLRQIYESIVKEGSVARSKSYRMMTQNGDFIKLETEWSSFINPWSMKLEFVIGKHYILEGPSNPNVFQSPEMDKALKLTEEEKNRAQALRETIIRIMNEVLTKPAEVAKQQMSKRCQDLALFMESLIEEQPKTEDELRLEIQDQDNSYYERDSVMLGGISPHHEYNDSKSSTETPLSYNQLNYNENLQRYFESHQPYCYEDYNTATGENVLENKKSDHDNSKCISPLEQSGDSNDRDVNSSCGSAALMLVSRHSPPAPFGDYQPVRLTESLLMKHNADMEKELVKMHRETRFTSKSDREKLSHESRQKKKEHLARCNASFQPSAVAVEFPQLHGVKRSMKQQEVESRAHKHHCPSPRQSRRKKTSSANTPKTSTITTTVATQWSTNNTNMNTFILGVGIPQQMSLVSPIPAMPGQCVFPFYYAAPGPPAPSTSDTNNDPSTSRFTQQPMQCMMYGQPMYGAPFVYSPLTPQASYPVQQTLMGAQNMHYSNPINPLGLNTKNYNESTKQAPEIASRREEKKQANRNSDETVDRTDGESSYSSFYSSFFKTESGSAEESGDARKQVDKPKNSMDTSRSFFETQQTKKIARRKMEPPWMEQVCVSSELIYKYQILTKTMDEVLLADKEKMSNLEQPSLVNEQLGQLYLDLQLEGVAAKLTLEEGITSSSSSGEETSKPIKRSRRKREYSKLVMIYEEDAPLPPPTDTPTTSTTKVTTS